MGKDDCWARALGDCQGPISGEHFVSANVFGKGAAIDVQGFRWCKTHPKRIPIERLTANILCKHHNERLSPVDAMGGRAFRSLKTSAGLNNNRQHSPPGQWIPYWFDVDGPLLERWFLKTLINFMVVGYRESGWLLDHPPEQPPLSLVRAAFGVEPIPEPMGLYAVGKIGDEFASSEQFQLSPLWTPEETLAGGTFRFYGFHFVFVAAPVLPPTFSSEHGLLWDKSHMMRHPARIKMQMGDRLSCVLAIAWPGRPRNCFALEVDG